jgi:hypothetical protein
LQESGGAGNVGMPKRGMAEKSNDIDFFFFLIFLKVEWLVKLKLNQNLGSLLNLNSIVILRTISTLKNKKIK